MLKINCKSPILNFENKEMDYDSNGTKKKDSVGRYICDQLLLATLEPKDDPLEIYDLAKLFHDGNDIEITDEDANMLYTFIARCNIPTLIKGQLLHVLKIPEEKKPEIL